ncbi:PREDICTED: uncharacterized protein LOC107604146 [Ficedula albicollis]|uniref:uncharacterized protein LOC107604146 n=1 Tax=Ficedula albicollis TaxID=59894 RepID=UPI0007AD81AB|nr:PREDICTED: uncharacterized protein LOC107604146 [Ficedula albicollis]
MEGGEAVGKCWDTSQWCRNTLPVQEYIPSAVGYIPSAGIHSQCCWNTFPVLQGYIPSGTGTHSQCRNTLPVQEYIPSTGYIPSGAGMHSQYRNTFPVVQGYIPSGAGIHSQWCRDAFPVQEYIPSAGMHSQWYWDTFPVQEYIPSGAGTHFKCRNIFRVVLGYIPSAGIHSQWCTDTFPLQEYIPSGAGMHSQYRNTFPVVQGYIPSGAGMHSQYRNTFPVQEYIPSAGTHSQLPWVDVMASSSPCPRHGAACCPGGPGPSPSRCGVLLFAPLAFHPAGYPGCPSFSLPSSPHPPRSAPALEDGSEPQRLPL